ncbi:MAG: hypothetical protein V1493_04250 [Candidatus Diapherotrites archaeon]
MPEKEKFEKVCPKCGSRNVTAWQGIEYEMPVHAKCLDCDFEGLAFPEFPSEKIKKIQEEIRNKKRK